MFRKKLTKTTSSTVSTILSLRKSLAILLTLFFSSISYCQTITLTNPGQTFDCAANEFTFNFSMSNFNASASFSVKLFKGFSQVKSVNVTTDSNGDATGSFTYTPGFNNIGSHNMTAEADQGGTTYTSNSVTIVANDKLNVSITSSPSGTNYCPNSQVTFYPQSFDNSKLGNWSDGTNNVYPFGHNVTMPNNTGSNSTSGSISYTGTDLNNCANTAILNYTIKPAPNVLLAVSSTTLCSPTAANNTPSNNLDKVTVTATYNSNTTRAWSLPPNMSSTVVTSNQLTEIRDVFYNTNVAPNTISTISVTGTNAGCSDLPPTKSVTVTSRETPQADFTTPTPNFNTNVPFTNTSTFTVAPNVNIEYSWDFGDGNTTAYSSIANTNHTYVPVGFPGYFNVTLCARNTFGICATCTTKQIAIDGQPTASFSSADEACLKSDGNGGSYNSITFTNNSSSSIPGTLSSFTYLWDFGDGNSVTVNTNSNQTHTYMNVGTYTCSLTVTNGSNTASSVFTKTITINANPIINGTTDYLLTTGNCEDQSVEFKMGTFSSVTYTYFPMKWHMDYDGNNNNGTNSDGYDGYKYATNSTGFSPLTDPFNYTNNTPGTFDIKGKLEIVNTGCITTYIESFTINPTPTTTIQISPNVTGMCINTTSPPTISSSTAGSAYDWEYIPPSNTVWSSGNQTFSPQGSALEVGTASINLKVQNSYGCWSDVVTGSFDVWDVPVPSFTNTTVCDKNDNPTDFTNTTTGPQSTYAWDFGDNSGTSTSTNPTYNYAGPGTYSVELTVTENTNNCFESVSQNVIVKPNPTVDFSFGTINCEQQAVTFTDNSTLSGNTISSRYWDWDDGTNSTTTNQTQDHSFTPVYIGSSTSVSYDVTLTATASNGCYDIATETISINKRPAAPTLSVATNAQNHTNTICEGEQYTINASPSTGYSYSWFFNGNSMGAYYNNYISDYGVAPLPDSRPYSVRITDNNGCYNTSSNSTILVKHVNNYIGYTSGFTTLCPGSTVTLTGSVPTPAQSYEWYKAPYDPNTMTFGTYGIVGTNSKTHLVDNSNEGRYKYKGIVQISGGDDCVEESQTIDVINALPLALNYTGTVTIDVVNPQVVQHIANAYPTYTSFKWYRNGILVSTLATYQVKNPGKYYLVATGDCGIEKSNEVTFIYDCNSPGYNPNYTGAQNFTSGTTNLNTGTVMPTTVLMDADWTLSGGAVVNITDLIIVVGNCAKFNVTNGTLNLTNTEIVGCGEWNGIVIDGSNSSLNMNGGSVSDAVVGITSKNKGTLNVTQAKFDNNNIHIGFSANAISNSSFITFNKFGNLDLNTPNCTHPEYPSWSMTNYPMVYLEDVTGPTISGNEFICSNTSNSTEIEGIQTNGSNSLTISNNFDNGFLTRGIHVREGSNLTISDNTFEFKYATPLDLLFSRSAWFNTGISLEDAKGSTIDRNLVTNADEGIAFYQNTTVSVPTTNITRNRIESCNWGLVTATKENPATSVVPYQNSSTQMIYVQVNCNSFNNNSYGWIGTGGYSNQGTSLSPSGNTFQSNLNWNTCVAYNSNNYYWCQFNTAENPYGVTSGILILDGNTITSSNYSSNCLIDNPVIPSSTCSNKRDGSTDDAKFEDNPVERPITFNAYPNPFDNYVKLVANDNNSGKKFTLRIYDMSGRLMIESENSESVQIIDTQNWSNGVYFIQIADSTGLLFSEKLVKVN